MANRFNMGDASPAYFRGASAFAVPFGYVQLHNPVASGVTLFVNSINIGLNGFAAVATLRRFDTVGPTLTGAGFSKILGNPDGLGEVRTDPAIVAEVGTIIFPIAVIAARDTQLTLYDDPIIMAEGTGILVSSGATNVIVSFQWYEEPA